MGGRAPQTLIAYFQNARQYFIKPFALLYKAKYIKPKSLKINFTKRLFAITYSPNTTYTTQLTLIAYFQNARQYFIKLFALLYKAKYIKPKSLKINFTKRLFAITYSPNTTYISDNSQYSNKLQQEVPSTNVRCFQGKWSSKK